MTRKTLVLELDIGVEVVLTTGAVLMESNALDDEQDSHLTGHQMKRLLLIGVCEEWRMKL